MNFRFVECRLEDVEVDRSWVRMTLVDTKVKVQY
jgi:hypothetical protein